LVSLMASHSYHVVGDVASAADIDSSLLVADAPRLVILGALPADKATAAAGSIRKLWPETKIILLFEHASSADLQKLLASEIDGCIPLFASPDTLIGTLQQIIAADLRILVLKTATDSSMPRLTGWREEGDELDLDANNLVRSDEAESGAIDRTISVRIPHGLSEREEESHLHVRHFPWNAARESHCEGLSLYGPRLRSDWTLLQASFMLRISHVGRFW